MIRTVCNIQSFVFLIPVNRKFLISLVRSLNLLADDYDVTGVSYESLSTCNNTSVAKHFNTIVRLYSSVPTNTNDETEDAPTHIMCLYLPLHRPVTCLVPQGSSFTLLGTPTPLMSKRVIYIVTYPWNKSQLFIKPEHCSLI